MSFHAIRDDGHVHEGVYDGWYCPRCADFKTEAGAISRLEPLFPKPQS